MQTGRVTKQKCLRSVCFMSDFGRGSVGGRKRPHVSLRYPDLERSFKQMALETLIL